ncbi:MAG: hypothetical protein LIP77_06425 [Planctomycetes bacterium]|nr:hypothetical protein [Planctomycetota bacterium]
MRTYSLVVLLAVAAALFLSGCGKIKGPRYWWDDRNQARLDGYYLPDDPGAPDDAGYERITDASGEDLTEDDLRDYRTNLDLEEERRKSESSILDF